MNHSQLINNLLSFHKSLFQNKERVAFGKKRPRLRRLKVRGTDKFIRYYLFGRYVLIEQNPFSKRKSNSDKDDQEVSLLIDIFKNKFLYKIINNKLFKL